MLAVLTHPCLRLITARAAAVVSVADARDVFDHTAATAVAHGDSLWVPAFRAPFMRHSLSVSRNFAHSQSSSRGLRRPSNLGSRVRNRRL